MAGASTGSHVAPSIALDSTALAFTGFCRIPTGSANKGVFAAIPTTNWAGVLSVTLADDEVGTLVVPIKEGQVPSEIRQMAAKNAGETYFPYNPGA